MSGYWDEPIGRFLRNAPKTLARSAYAVEANPWATKGEIEAAPLFRGTIVSAYGFIETTLGEICLRASRIEQYAELRGHFPFSTRKRIIFLRSAFSQGPLVRFKDTAKRFFDKLDRDEEIRNLVAHAKMQVMSEGSVLFVDYPERYDGGVMRRNTPMLLGDLEVLAWKSALRSRLTQKLYDRLNKTEVLPVLQS